MLLKSITLKDWKQYVHAKLDFGGVSPKKNIVLVGAKNGYGKTGLFEAFVLGLFGRDGLSLIARAPFVGASEEKLQTSYSQFLERALNGHAVSEGRTNSSIQFLFENDDGQPIEIKRTWNFSQTGKFLNPKTSEDVQVYFGIGREPLGPNADESESDRLGWYRDYIAKTFIPANLAAFFLFDGERVGEFADREMSVQVKVGIEGLLGIPVLKELAQDLRQYAASKNVSVKDGGQDLNELQEKRNLLDDEIGKLKDELAEASASYRVVTAQIESLTNELGGFGSGTQAQMHDLITRQTQLRQEYQQLDEKIKNILKDDLSVAILASSDLGKVAIDRLKAEQSREKWLAGRDSGEGKLEQFLNLFSQKISEVKPDLLGDQKVQLNSAVHESWGALWHPEPTGCATQYLHAHISGLDREKVIESLQGFSNYGAGDLIGALDRVQQLNSEIQRLNEELDRTSSVSPKLDEKKKKLSDATSLSRTLYAQIDSFNNSISGKTSELDALQKSIARLTQQADSKLPDVRRAQRAQQVAAMIDRLVVDAVPHQIKAVAESMTRAFKQLAHKHEQISEVVVTSDCEVKLLNKAGRDLRDYDLSAGEKQIFTQALISAIVEVSGRNFPLIIDTPLGRLDDDHRINVLNHLANRDSQVVLLSSPTEVIGKFYGAIKDHVAKTYMLKFEGTKDMGITRIVEGYFED